MAEVTAPPAPSRSGGFSWIWRRQLDSYPDTRPRVMYLAITVLASNGAAPRRARAAALLTLALPGSTYLYQGEELGRSGAAP